MAQAIAAFVTVNTRALRRRGVYGSSATVTLFDGAIAIAGSAGGMVHFPFGEIIRLRAGYEEYRSGPRLSVQLWPRDGTRPLRLHEWEDRAGYARFVRACTSAMLHAPSPVVVETGAGWFILIVFFGIFGPFTLVAVAATVRSLATGGDWVSPGMAAAAGAVLLYAPGRWIVSRHVPRRMTDPTDVERAFPPR